MLLKKSGYPEEGELVLCTVSDIQFHSVFVKLDEYDTGGMIHISEVSPGRIRNIRDFVAVGKKVVCKILKVNLEKRHIDLSLRRVNEGQKKEKINEIKHEQKAEKIIEFAAQELKIELKDLYKMLWDATHKNGYLLIHEAFNDVVISDLSLEKLGIEKKIAVKLEELIRQRIKPPEVRIGGTLNLQSYQPDGVSLIKKVIIEHMKPEITIKYEGAGKYSVSILKSNYKDAEKELKELVESIEEKMLEADSIASFVRKETKK